ncbi:MAG: AgmX/PglI C-terminal domain-containing protein [Cellvibrionaceae bacterium]
MTAYHAPNLEMPWYSSYDDDRRFNKILKVAFAIFLLFAIAIPFIPVPELTREERETLPPQLAQVVMEKKEIPPPPPPPPEPEPQPEEQAEAEPEPEPEPELEPEPEPEPPPEPVDRVNEARERAASSGLLQFQDDLADMRDAIAPDRVDNSNLTRGSGEAAQVDRSVITSGARGTSGGINTAALSRDTGGVALSGRETTKVESELAERSGSGEQASDQAPAGQRRSDEDIRRIMDRNKDAIFAIYNRALRSNPALQGKVTVKLTIDPSGQVTAAEIVSSELNDQDLESRLISRIRLIAFGASDRIRTVVNYSFDFLPY